MAQAQRGWTVAVTWINLVAVAAVPLMLLASDRGLGWDGLWRRWLYALVYANVAGVPDSSIRSWSSFALTYAAVAGKAHCVDHSIAELERRLDSRRFLRIHRATLVNLAYVKEVAPLPGGGLNVRLKDDLQTDLTVSRDRARLLKERLGY